MELGLSLTIFSSPFAQTALRMAGRKIEGINPLDGTHHRGDNPLFQNILAINQS